jgi:hypothetical protein
MVKQESLFWKGKIKPEKIIKSAVAISFGLAALGAITNWFRNQ